MAALRLPVCRHRGGETSPGVHHCHSPKLVGLKLVTADTCGACYCRDHDVAPDLPPGSGPLLPCAHLGPALGPADDGAVHACTDPRHQRTTAAQCGACPDYLFPVLLPHTPVEAVRRVIALPARPQPDGWWLWRNVQQAHREAADEAVARSSEYAGDHAGRGVVILGGGRYFVAAYVTVRVLRHVGCTLPVQLWHLAGEVTDRMRELLRPYGVECVDADAAARERPFRFLDGHWWRGWQLKPFALVHSPFREVLLLDADSYPVRDPSFLFDWPPYRERGAVFWPDSASSAGLWTAEKCAVFGIPPGDPALESGQMVVDKRRCWRELQLTLWYNAHADFVYRILWGDKDTFNVAWRRLGRAYALPQPACGWDLHTLLQYGPDGRVLFQHRCGDKFRLPGETFSSTPQFHGDNLFNPRLAHEDLCFAFREELRRALQP
jgi:hypothetical protein